MKRGWGEGIQRGERGKGSREKRHLAKDSTGKKQKQKKQWKAFMLARNSCVCDAATIPLEFMLRWRVMGSDISPHYPVA